ncbi:hypothetical protein [Streptomyces sp. NPDC092952]|uniref:hypothetical protein n=1 Tax=Streptomyces sp. NPDC092952 TaxID=3366018 RepID=UPI003800043C
MSESAKILEAWDFYSDEHTDLDGWPHDELAYGLRASQRDADTMSAFEPLQAGVRHLLATAEVQLVRLPANTAQSRWVYQLGVLRSALDQLDELRDEWLENSSTLRPGTAEFDNALALHQAESWSYLDDWASHGHALREINTAARGAPSSLTPAPALAPVRRTAARK